MHRRSLPTSQPPKRGRSPIQTRSATKRARLEQEAYERQRHEDREYWNRRYEMFVDNQDRNLLMENTRSQRPLSELPRGVVPFNAARRLDAMRTTGSQLAARTIRSRSQPVNRLLYGYKGYDPQRGVYRCANCGTNATPSQLRNWFNPGYHPIDLALTMPLTDRTAVDLFGEPISGAMTPVNRPPLLQANDLFTVQGQGILAVPNHHVPVVFTCSERCAEEQIRHNYARTSRHQTMIQAANETTSLLGGASVGSHAWVQDLFNTAPEVIYLPNDDGTSLFFNDRNPYNNPDL